jgi:pyruvate dehydrogenase (quinone)
VNNQEAFKKVEEGLATYVKNRGKENEIQPEFVAFTIDRLAAKDAIFTVDTGMSAVWAARFIKGGTGRYLTGSFNHGSMANSMPQAIGAALGCPDRQVIAFSGDGGLSMLLGDLMTIGQYKLPIKIIVFNNRALGMVKLEMQVAGYPDWQTDMVNPPFDQVAELMGFKGFEIRDPEHVERILQEALAHEGPALVNVFTNPDALAMPPRVEWDQVKGFMTSMVKLMAEGRTGEVLSTVKSNFSHLKELF